jgi:WD40 repeat protein
LLTIIQHFALSTTDAQAISWSPCVRFIAVSESLLSVSLLLSLTSRPGLMAPQYGLFIHSPLGPLLNSFSYTSASFSSSSTSEDPGLGVRCMTWAPTGDWIALGGWDGKIRVVESEAGRCMGIVGYAARTVEAGTVSTDNPSSRAKLNLNR